MTISSSLSASADADEGRLQPVPGRRNLLCVLDWGLGHAARSIALADRLMAAGETVTFAASGDAASFLRQERPQLICRTLPPYRVRYFSASMPWNVARQLPRWLATIYREHRLTCALADELSVDRIISDSRFGCYDRRRESIFLTHQLHPITHNRLVSYAYRLYLQRFDGFWVPDHANHSERLSGQLSNPRGYRSVTFIGPLSRLKEEGGKAPFEVLALLSGPEPMRSRLEEQIVRQLGTLPGRHVLVRGLPGETPPLVVAANVEVHAFAPADLLSRLLPAARYVVCRSGYSTLMDVHALTDPRKLILIPTPGQTEQIYLAKREAARTGCRSVRAEEELRLAGLISRAAPTAAQ